MFKRLAFFEGHVLPGKEQEFSTFVRDRLVPLWTRFPNATIVEVLRHVEAEEASAPHFAMILSLTYPSREAIAEALASPVRFESRAESAILLKMFEGRVFHVIYGLNSYPMVQGA